MYLGLSGGIGCGKSTVAKMLSDLGAVVIDADAIAKEVLEPGQIGYENVIHKFGDGVLDTSGNIDRKKLAEIVFNDSNQLEVLESITHPLIRAKFVSETRGLPENSVVVYEIPLLAESISRQKQLDFDHVLVLQSNPEIRVSRLIERGFSAKEAQLRIANQYSDAQRKEIATHLIKNEGSLEELINALSQWWSKFISPEIAK